MKEIKLSRGKVALVDDKDFDFLSKYKWNSIKSTTTYYAQTFIYENKKRKTLIMHRLILSANKGMDVDHIDGNGLNNQRHNIRVCTRSENIANRHCRTGKSKYIGVHMGVNVGKKKTSKFWRAQIRKNYKSIHLGCFKTEEDAAKAYNEAAKKIHGEFANINIV